MRARSELIMRKPRIYIDGQAGTTGLQIRDRLLARDDLELIEIPDALRKDPQARKERMAAADLVFLCLPDAAAIEAVALMEGLDTKIIDASTAHRTSPEWVYGFSELSKDQKEAVLNAKRLANPGCHASGFIALVYPLVKSGLLDEESSLHAFSLTGYSGGGKKMIADYEQNKSEEMASPKPYALSLHHKHLPEMKTVCHLKQEPLFVPIVDDYKEGMLVQVFLDQKMLKTKMSREQLEAFYRDWYKDADLIQVADDENALFASTLAGCDEMELRVSGDDQKGFILSARFDNLGKGASGAAVQNMNLMLGLDENAGLRLRNLDR